MELSRLLQARNNRLIYYVKGYLQQIYPKTLLKRNYAALQQRMLHCDEKELSARLDYYNKNTQPFELSANARSIRDIPLKGSGSMYWLDLMEYARYFPQGAKLDYLFLDVTHVPETPTLVKSRPIATAEIDNRQSVLYKFCKIRNFKFYDDPTPFRKKKDKLIWRGAVYQKHRIAFMEKFFGKSPLIDVGQVNKSGNRNPQWQMPFMTIQEQLENKFIFSIEGNDVATNTKWGLASNSVLLMKKPKYETWLMEGELQAGVHYVELADDYRDLEEKIEHYIANPDEAEAIIANANRWADRFKDPAVEDWLGLKILERYFEMSGQL